MKTPGRTTIADYLVVDDELKGASGSVFEKRLPPNKATPNHGRQQKARISSQWWVIGVLQPDLASFWSPPWLSHQGDANICFLLVLTLT